MNAERCSGVVLVVDDEEDTRELLRELLEDQGFNVATAADGDDALDVINTLPRICLVILDLMMPRMGGVEVVQRLSKDPKNAALPIIVSTSAPDRAPAGVPCLPKPVEVQRLVSVVEAHCLPDDAA